MISRVTAPLEFKAAHNGETGEFEGYAAVYGTMDRTGDVIAPGAFAETLLELRESGRPVAMHFNHGLPELAGVRGVGVWKHLREDGRGLRGTGKLSGMNTDAGRYLFERVKDGAVGGLSIGFAVRAGGAELHTGSNRKHRRTIRSADLVEVSLVDDPAHLDARVDGIKARLAAGELPEPDELAAELRRLGFSSDQAGAIATLGLKSLHAPTGGERDPASLETAAKALREMRELAAGISLASL